MDLARLVEDILRLKMDVSVQEKVQESPLTQNIDTVKAKCLKKKESSRGRRRFKSSLEVALTKNKEKRLTNCQSQIIQVIVCIINELVLYRYNIEQLLSSGLIFAYIVHCHSHLLNCFR